MNCKPRIEASQHGQHQSDASDVALRQLEVSIEIRPIVSPAMIVIDNGRGSLDTDS
eukprot:CAMPEP_0194769690 /NCGR_PEP_ID=MMETSP0323_2-20130528/43946_1 /TAXON_ID=2866 ORGANISM="Crypthecodinium cohnii, Strain Seligo" /NCGR_SAMPLE_ID=MMETSP0323_2 /ASSEMBLY_ACC=CAM_ASM_000346 /LENGTH=55 /DNA_ID=CAMNT_0039702815 /DNA_START=95 /DNA_END=259 /DNA_ORIENTATION=-